MCVVMLGGGSSGEFKKKNDIKKDNKERKRGVGYMCVVMLGGGSGGEQSGEREPNNSFFELFLSFFLSFSFTGS